MKEFLAVPFEGLFRILLNTNVYEPEDKGLIGRICAEWICRDFDDRVVKLVKLVNATKHRYGIFHYLGANAVEEQSIIDSLREIDENHRVEEVEERFNELLSYYGDVKFDPSQLADEISDESRNRIINAIDLPGRWCMFLEKGLFHDVVINVRGVTYKLHRIKLLTSSTFFQELFIKSSKSIDSNVSVKSEKLTIETYTFDEINPAAFEKIVNYIYGKEIEITSEDLIINVLKASHFFKMEDLYDECNAWCLRSISKMTSAVFDLFQFASEKEKNTDLYDDVVQRILSMWPKFNDNAFKNISLKVLKELVALPDLSLDSTDEVVDLCSKWIFHDLGKRYPHMYKIAKAVNRNFAPCIKRMKLETPDAENLVECSIETIKKHLTEILSSSALVSSNFDPCYLEFKHKPRFMATKTEGTLSIMDEYFNEIVSINPKTLPVYSSQDRISIIRHSATMIDDKLFILFNTEDKFYFYVYLPSSKKFISLADDVRMNPLDNYVILNFNGEVSYLEDYSSLKYCFHLNRWITILERGYSQKWYTSNGKILFKVSCHRPPQLALHSLGVLKAWFFDAKAKTWVKLPNVPVRPSAVSLDPVKWENLPISVNVIENDFCVLFKRKTYFFHWKTQTWSSIDNLYQDFLTFTEREQNILYISAENGVQLYSPVQKQWIADQQLNNFKSITPIHTVMK
ncbi:uncharacterized protein LOC135843811 [Planococcus citri]|uniref:uncharacterized protein LOC135843811 n=1 Tax=Planococcus citri TaxID=170843 RepID=UPI0031F9A124